MTLQSPFFLTIVNRKGPGTLQCPSSVCGIWLSSSGGNNADCYHGNGVAGNSAASIVKKFDYEVTIISEEIFPEYSACALPYYLCGEIPRQHVFLKKREQYLRAGVHTIFGKKVARIEVKNQEVIFEDVGLKYDKLVIATGAKAMVPQIGGPIKQEPSP